jgi:hypothetical protein
LEIELQKYSQTNEKSKRLMELLEYIENNDSFRQAGPPKVTSRNCNLCRFFLNYLINGYRNGFAKGYIAYYSNVLCSLVGQSREVCKGLVDMNIVSISMILNSNND